MAIMPNMKLSSASRVVVVRAYQRLEMRLPVPEIWKGFRNR